MSQRPTSWSKSLNRRFSRSGFLRSFIDAAVPKCRPSKRARLASPSGLSRGGGAGVISGLLIVFLVTGGLVRLLDFAVELSATGAVLIMLLTTDALASALSPAAAAPTGAPFLAHPEQPERRTVAIANE